MNEVSTSKVAVTGETGWQPARLIVVPGKSGDAEDYLAQDDMRRITSRIVFIRKAEPTFLALKDYREEGCDAKVFYEIRPDAMDGTPNEGGCMFVCEHEVLTD